MSDGPTRGRGRRSTPPPRDILGGQVRDDELPDVARPAAAAPAAPPSAPRAGGIDPMRALADVWWAPLRVAGAVLDGQADAIAKQIGSGAVPPALVPGATVYEAQLRAAALVLRAIPGVAPPAS